MAIEPKTPRKRAVKKVTQAPVDPDIQRVDDEVKKRPTKRKVAPAIPVPIFQAAAIEAKPAKLPRGKSEGESVEVEAPKRAVSRRKASPVEVSEVHVEESSGEVVTRSRRRRGGRGRRRPSDEVTEVPESDESGEDSTKGPIAAVAVDLQQME
jgi:hypothetical protein